jgi:hypothetical protein
MDPSDGTRFWRFLAGLAVRYQADVADLANMRTRRGLPSVQDAKDYDYKRDVAEMLDWVMAEPRTPAELCRVVAEVLIGGDNEFYDLALRYAGITSSEPAASDASIDDDNVIDELTPADAPSDTVGQCEICKITNEDADADGFGFSWANDDESLCSRCAGITDALLDFVAGNHCTDAELQEALVLEEDEIEQLVSALVTAKRIESKKKRWKLTSTELLARKKAEAKR